MSGRIRCCKTDHTYTLSATCPVCGKPTAIAHPARFSVEDRYGKYRRMAKND
ncbi:MAG TPA: RNA-protein complex protein Nop10 [Methanoregula sp.]|nr:RNA-protein complex protein Nop10 [Methanoregula sp.]HJX56971.1 RNA-protein complex protein Nop10 [Methanoregula sp.]